MKLHVLKKCQWQAQFSFLATVVVESLVELWSVPRVSADYYIVSCV